MSVQIIIGDALEVLRGLPDESADCCVTSPPYWGLRDYGVAGQMGLEPTLAEHIAAQVELFEEVRRILKPHGTFFLNYGDCYATSPNGRSAADTKAARTDDRTFRDKPFSTVGPIERTPEGGYPAAEQRRRMGEAPRAAAGPIYQADDSPRNKSRQGRSGNLGNGGVNGAGLAMGRVAAGGYLKPKDLCMIPNRLAIALQDAGWWVRSEIIWRKTNPMPDSSGAYRPSSAHEKIFMLTKSADAPVYRARDTGEIRFDPDLTERRALVTLPDVQAARWVKIGAYWDAEAVRVQRSTIADGKQPDGWDTGEGGHGTIHREGRQKGKRIDKQRGHSRRHQGFNDRWDGMDRAEQMANGRLLRNAEGDLTDFLQHIGPDVWDIATAAYHDAHFATFPPDLVVPCILGGCPRGGTVIDPFGGSGTTGLVAQALGRDAILIELNPEYAAMAEKRLKIGALRPSGRRMAASARQIDLFGAVA
ncbi:site-specific DNA-methyltransferase [Blastomonas sp.]|uniref:DNA-methyltransferase n=1 Tax=Blastomonas sp. TaxID=1909299 RepID=UPI002588CE42|nr:site-specific DNA-methyltransferase [Blastomonas sp.]